MPTINSSIHRATISLKLPAKVADFIAYATGIVHAMTNNPAFPTPVPALAALSAAVSDLQAAETLALTKARGTVPARNDKRAVVVSLLQQLRGYVQAVADATPENGATIIQSAGLAVRKLPQRGARVFAAAPGPVSGSAKLTATIAARRASYEWQYSTDGGKTWVSAPASLQAKTTIVGLPAGSSVQFRCKTVTKTGEGDWSQAIALLVK
ncbi:MAG TPA: hypothetical protein VHS09_00575 [Polyangiaceae bacterium]|nr:hypothetical protein [Polyangiaceae bacterium]